MKELFSATNKDKTIMVHVFAKRKRYTVRWVVQGTEKEELFRDIDSAVSLFNALVRKYHLDITIF